MIDGGADGDTPSGRAAAPRSSSPQGSAEVMDDNSGNDFALSATALRESDTDLAGVAGDATRDCAIDGVGAGRPEQHPLEQLPNDSRTDSRAQARRHARAALPEPPPPPRRLPGATCRSAAAPSRPPQPRRKRDPAPRQAAPTVGDPLGSPPDAAAAPAVQARHSGRDHEQRWMYPHSVPFETGWHQPSANRR